MTIQLLREGKGHMSVTDVVDKQPSARVALADVVEEMVLVPGINQDKILYAMRHSVHVLYP